jgi:hypothetical protein
MPRRPRRRSFYCSTSPCEQARFLKPRSVQRLLQNLDIKCLATNLALQLTHPHFKPAQVAVAGHAVIRLHRRRGSLGHEPTRTVQQVRRDAITTRDGRDALAGLQRLPDDTELSPGAQRRRRAVPVMTSMRW